VFVLLLTQAGSLRQQVMHIATCFHVGILLGLFDSEDGGDMFLRKVRGISADYTALNPRR
jgi:hypothetical protein